ncbi:MAG: fumarylacetoacetase [Limisphaerales bacterium]|jgi:fumarylacetoacetase
MVEANDPSLKSWISISANSDFPIQNIPFGLLSSASGPHAATAIGDQVLDLAELNHWGLLENLQIPQANLEAESLNDLIGMGKPLTTALRNRIAELLSEDNAELRDNAAFRAKVLSPMADAVMLMPVSVGDYTDFYSSIDHATNVGTMFRDPENALLPNWKHIPVGYHGRASSIVVSGAKIHRPKGQQIPADTTQPVFGPSKLLDFELEVAFVVGKNTELGDSVSTKAAEEHIFGLVLFNDLSARDIQKWEYIPLGPFLAKNFGSVISPWIVTLEALENFRVDSYTQDPEVLPYLKSEGQKNYDINLTVDIEAPGQAPHTICHSNFKYMYWNMCQQLAHHTVNGCNINVGDMCASGTISGPEPSSFGSMLELSWKGTKPIPMPDGSERKFLKDGDACIMRGWAEKDGIRIGFGESRTEILAAK